MNIGIILAGGIGSRFASDVPKQYQQIHGKEVLFYSYNALNKSPDIDKIIITSQAQFIPQIKTNYPNADVIEGGSSRNGSLYNGLSHIKKTYEECKKVIILEAARPMITPDIVSQYLTKLDSYDSVITGQKIVDSLGSFHKHVTFRTDYYLIQAPEAFNFNVLFDNFNPNSEITATNQQMPENSTLYINFDFITNMKITYFQDLAYCEQLMNKDR